MIGPLLISEHGAVGRVFANGTQQPLAITGPLKAAIESHERPEKAPRAEPMYFDTVIAGVSHSTFPWLFVCDADRLTRPVPANIQEVAHEGRFRIYAVNQQQK